LLRLSRSPETTTTSINPLASFTAAQIAAALGSSRQLVQRTLVPVRADGKQLVRGNEALTWSFSSLPAPMQRKLDRRAAASAFRNAEHLLRAGAGRYESPVPVNQLAGPVQARAMRLREALALPLDQHGEGMKGAALEALGQVEYKRVFEFEISGRHWRGLFNRAITRDAGEEQWSRLDLYLDDRPHVVRVAKAVATSPRLRDAEKILLGYASQVRIPSEPTNEEKAMLWSTAFDQTVELVEAGMTLRSARQAMRRVLWKCGVTIAKNEITLGESFRTKEKAWRESHGSFSVLKDARSLSSGNHRTPEIPQGDLDLVIGHAVKFGGRVSQAWRYVIENNLLSPVVQSYYTGLYFASKSYVPRVIRDAVTTDTRLLEKIHRGPRAAKLEGAYITRDWSGTAAGDWYQADDVTFNNYYYAPDEKGRMTPMRGQVLLMIDLRSTCILGFMMLDQRNYTSHSIRTLITRTCDDHGLPRRGFYFEKGIWQSSRLLKGDRSVSNDELTWTESEGGLRDLGLEFKHAQLPRAKPIERVIGQIQNLLDGTPGDAGREEMKKPFERFNDRKRLVESGKARHEDLFFSADQAEASLARACAEYNEARNDGQMTKGLTPQRAWEYYQKEPLVRLTGNARHLLACHKNPVKVTRNGIRLKFGKKAFVYHDENTGRFEGQMVLAWFNPEMPEILSVTDMNRENVFTVEASADIDAMNAPADVLAHEMARVAGHNRHARVRYRAVARRAGLNPRPTYMDHDSARLGSDMAAQQEEILSQRKQAEKREKSGRAVISSLGFATRPDEDYSPKRIVATEKVLRELAEFKEENT
jgi:hypothetical protein